MRFLMLCREPRLYSCQRLKMMAEKCGHQMDILDPNRCILKLQQNSPHFTLYYQADKQAMPYLLPHYDGVFPRFGASSTAQGCAVLKHFQAKDIPCLNEEQAILLARDKWRSLQVLAQAGIAIPETQLAGNELHAQQLFTNMVFPLVLKTLSGMQGDGVMLATDAQSAVKIWQDWQQPLLIQEFIAESAGSDIRCFVIGEKVIATMQRRAQHGEFRANCHLGGSAEQIVMSEKVKQIAVKATKAIGLDIAGVDLILSCRGFLVLEVNASPGLEMIEKTNQLNIAQEIIDYFVSKITNSAKSSGFDRTLA